MTDQVDDALPGLVQSHRRLFRGQNPGRTLPVGWFELVHKLCNDIEVILGDDVDALTVYEVKSKFGSLRFYVSLALPEPPGEPLPATVREHAGGHTIAAQSRHPKRRAIDEAIALAGLESEQTCETCSEPGEQFVDGGFVYVACELHARVGSITAAEWIQRKRGGNR